MAKFHSEVTVLLLLIFHNKCWSTKPEDDYEFCSKTGVIVSEVFCLPDSYRKDVPPPSLKPLLVIFKLPITEISEINDHKSIVTIRLGYKLKWPETRMIVNKSADWSKGEINISPDNINHLWTPDIIIHDLVRFNKPQILNEGGALEIKRDKTVYYKVRCDITIVCKAMEFRQYPLDRHNCYLLLTSFGYDSKLMTLKGSFWYDKKNQRTLPFNVEINDLPEHKTIFTGSSSNYSVYGFEIQLSRSLGPFLLSIYLPSAMFVTMSWFSFFIPPDIVPARIVLLVTLCLVLINMFNSTTTRIPVSNAVTAMEVWLLACMLLVFLSLVEYAVILRHMVIYRRKLESPRMGQAKVGLSLYPEMNEINENTNGTRENHSLTTLLDKDGDSVHIELDRFATKDGVRHRWKRQKRKKKYREVISPEEKLNRIKNQLDIVATYIFPLLFLVFNTIYWVLYLLVFKEAS